MGKAPAILLCFANDYERSGSFLKELQREQKFVNEQLKQAEDANLCEVIIIPGCTVSDIVKVFGNKKFKNRIAIFHFSGHASSYQILLETSEGHPMVANGDGLATFLGLQQGLRLVVLNGCATRGQVKHLQEKGIPAVISTMRPVQDKSASDWAIRFYTFLAGSDSIGRSFKGAEAVRWLEANGNDRGVGRKLRTQQLPWQLNITPGHEMVVEWDLAKAADNPLFNIPDPIPCDIPNDPFPSLQWYTSGHARIFFGRDEDIRDLYQKVMQDDHPIVLLYGQSGVGKSSLLDAGLAPRLRRRHQVIYERLSTASELSMMFSSEFGTDDEDEILGKWKQLEESQGQPVILIVDQADLLFQYGIENGAAQIDYFLKILALCFKERAKRPRGKIILAIQEEYLARAEEYLRSEHLYYTTQYVKSLDQTRVMAVLDGIEKSPKLSAHFKLTIEPGLANEIAQDLTEDAAPAAVAPTLQLLLHSLWTKAIATNRGQPQFTKDLYYGLKLDGIWLDDFIDRGLSKVTAIYEENGLALDLLVYHITPIVTGCERTHVEMVARYRHVLSDLNDILVSLIESYLLLSIPDQGSNHPAARLAHDILAPLLMRRYNESSAPGQRARTILESRILEKASPQDWSLLSERDIEIISEGKDGMRIWTPREYNLITESKRSIALRKRKFYTMYVSIVVAVIAFLMSQRYLHIEKEISKEASLKFQSSSIATTAMRLANKDSDQVWLSYNMAKSAFRKRANLQTVGALSEISRLTPLYFQDLEITIPQNTGAMLDMITEQTYCIHTDDGIYWGEISLPIDNELEKSPASFIVDITTDQKYALVIRSDSKKGYAWVKGEEKFIFEFDLRALPDKAGFYKETSYIVVIDKIGRNEVWALWDKETMYHDNSVKAIDVSNDGSVILTADIDGNIYNWWENGLLTDRLDLSIDVRDIAILNSHQYICATARGIAMGNMASRTPPDVLPPFGRGDYIVVDLAADPDADDWIVVVDRFNKAGIYSLKERRLIAEIGLGHPYLVNAAIHRGDGLRAATVHEIGKVNLWDVARKTVIDSITLSDHIHSIEFSPHGDAVLLGSSNDTAYIYDIAKDGTFSSYNPIKLPHHAAVNAAHYSSDGLRIITSSSDYTAQMWTEQGEWLTTFLADTIVVDAAFVGEGDQVILCDMKGRCNKYSISPEKIIDRFDPVAQNLNIKTDES